MANRLVDEQSPYLLQHAHNPVDWYAWGDEPFEIAKNQNKPVLVSIGYAACHWCHVMERESFEDEATAKYMNEHFVCIKVDREEHPDVDHLYMDAVQAITKSGGWPLNVFVTPERVPFFGGTYFPPQPVYGRQSWMQILERISEVWNEQYEDVAAQTQQMVGYLQQLSEVAINSEGIWDKKACLTVAQELMKSADRQNGGFGAAPKFPATMSIGFLLEHYHYTGDKKALERALFSLDCMMYGGIYDQIGGGFARYSVDDKWLVPHFEKMLYDNALLVSVLSDAYSITKEEKYKRVIDETVAFVNRELRSEEGGFYCALDADSEGVEGKFYVWSYEEFNEITGGDNELQNYFDVTPEGNWEGVNILNVPVRKEVPELQEKVEAVKQKLFTARAERIRPGTDDKCLLAWNALMNTALQKAGVALNNSAYLQQAEKHAWWMIDAYGKNEVWQHTYKNGVAKIPAKLDDLAYLVNALTGIASVTGKEEFILKANKITEVITHDFLHKNKSFFYYSSAQQKDIPVRKTDLYDGATPSANSVMADNLLRLGLLMENSAWLEQAQFMLHKMRDSSMRYPTSFSLWATLGQRNVAGNLVAISTGKGAEMMNKELLNDYEPHVYRMVNNGDKDIPVTKGKDATGDISVFICDMESCKPPQSNKTEVLKMLKKPI